MQTEESVRIRKSDLESWKTVEGMDPEQMPAPEEVKTERADGPDFFEWCQARC